MVKKREACMKRLGVINIGTNSIKFHVAELTPERKIVTILDEIEITKLGEGLRAVSYTHLDVYKRQRGRWLFWFIK